MITRTGNWLLALRPEGAVSVTLKVTLKTASCLAASKPGCQLKVRVIGSKVAPGGRDVAEKDIGSPSGSEPEMMKLLCFPRMNAGEGGSARTGGRLVSRTLMVTVRLVES